MRAVVPGENELHNGGSSTCGLPLHHYSLRQFARKWQKNRERGSMAAMAQSCASFAMLLVTECKQRTTQERELPLAGTDFPDLFRHVMNV